MTFSQYATCLSQSKFSSPVASLYGSNFAAAAFSGFGTLASASADARCHSASDAVATNSTSAQFCQTCVLSSQSQRHDSRYEPGAKPAGTRTESRTDHSHTLFPNPVYAS